MRELLNDKSILIALGDGGAHVDMLCDAGYPTYLLGTWVRERQIMTLEAGRCARLTSRAGRSVRHQGPRPPRQRQRRRHRDLRSRDDRLGEPRRAPLRPAGRRQAHGDAVARASNTRSSTARRPGSRASSPRRRRARFCAASPRASTSPSAYDARTSRASRREEHSSFPTRSVGRCPAGAAVDVSRRNVFQRPERFSTSAIFSAIITVVKCVLARTTVGITEASITRRPVHADHAAVGIDHRARVVGGAHAAGAAGVLGVGAFGEHPVVERRGR